MNTLDKQYTDLLQDILDNGVKKETRNGGTLSVFGRQIRHKMSTGFPLLTTKKMPFRLIATELLWFLRGDTNIKFLVDNDCHIWDGDAYKNYLRKVIHDKDIVRYLKSYSIDTKGVPTIEFYLKDEYIERIKNDDQFAKKWGELGPVYGAQWRDWNGKTEVRYPGVRDEKGHLKPFHIKTYGIDQIQNLINDLKTNPDSRRLMVNAWNVGELDSMVLPPCHYGFQVYTRELSEQERMDLYNKSNWNKDIFPSDVSGWNRLFDTYKIPTRAISLMWNQRSVDTPLGLPFNIASYGLLLEIIAKAVNMIPDELIGNLGDCHIYLDQVDGVKEQITRHSFALPTLNINTEWWPTESGECGVGPLDAVAVFNGFNNDNFCKCLLEEDLQLSNYQSHPTIKFPLSN
jgi:thymidylate synthase